MKNIKIGRGNDCQIFLDDARISRNHALLKISTWGKMEIIDMSSNGTFVNGVKLPQGRPFPVSRKDVVSFAGAETLKWELVPNPMRLVMWGGIAAAVIALLALALVLINSFRSEPEFIEDAGPATTSSPVEKKGDAKEADQKADDESKRDNFFKKPNEEPHKSAGKAPAPKTSGGNSAGNHKSTQSGSSEKSGSKSEGKSGAKSDAKSGSNSGSKSGDAKTNDAKPSKKIIF